MPQIAVADSSRLRTCRAIVNGEVQRGDAVATNAVDGHISVFTALSVRLAIPRVAVASVDSLVA